MSPYILSLLACAGLLCVPGNAAAAVLTVTSDADSGAGSLRAAMAAALEQAGADEIVFDAVLNGRTITLAGGELATGVQQLTLDASALPGGIILSGGGVNRILHVTAGGTLDLRSLTLQGGHASGGDGGAALNAGTLTLSRCTVRDCTAAGEGGAISNHGSLTVTQSTFAGNSANAGGAVAGDGTLTMTHCTVSGNSATVTGGGLRNESSLTLTNSIVAGNSAAAGADIFNSGTVTRTGVNLVQALHNAGGSDSGPAAIAAAPQLFPLANYGGPTPTMPPRAVSPALDRIASSSFTEDQRGMPRVMWGAADAGAVEAGTQTDGAWEVREFYYPVSRPASLESLEDALDLMADPSAVVKESAPAVVNHHDPDNGGGSGYFDGDQPVRVDNLTPDRAAGDDNNFATVARTFIQIAEEDDYTIGFSSSEGARLRIFGADFISSTRLNASNPANPAHSGNELSFPGLTDNSATLGVCHLTPGVYALEFVTWEQFGSAYYEVFAARGVHTSLNAAFRLAGEIAAGGSYSTGALTPQALPPVWIREFEDGPGDFSVTNVNAPFDGPWTLDEENGSWKTAGQGPGLASAPSTLLTSPSVVMHCHGDAVLQFTHRFSFEEGNWDGGQVLLSVNGGPFTLVPPAAFTLNGYTGIVTFTSIADIRGQPAFVFDSPGYVVPAYVTSTARLGTFNAGDSLRVQFLASFDRDTSRGNPAWEIDTVSIEQQCSGANPGWELTSIRNGADSLETALTQLFSHWAGSPQPNSIRSFAGTINLFDPQAGGGGHGQTQSPFPGDEPGDDNQFAVGARATLHVPSDDYYTFCVLADDAARFRIAGSQWWNVAGTRPVVTLPDGFLTAGGEEVFGQVFLTAGPRRIELIYQEGAGAAYLGLWGARGRYGRFDPEVFTPVGGPGMIRPASPFTLTRQAGLSRPANDDFASAAAASPRTVVCTAGAGLEPGEPGLASGTVWWRLSTGGGTVVCDTAGSDFDTAIAVYSGTSLSQLALLASNDNYDGSSAARVTVSVGTPGELYIQAGGAGPAAGRLALSISSAALPTNDAFATPLDLGSVFSVSASGENDAATAQPGEPAHAPGTAPACSVWFSWTAPVSGEFTLDALGSRYRTVLGVYTGNNLSGLHRVAGSGSGSGHPTGVSFFALMGVTYRIALDGTGPGERGTWRLNVAHRPAVVEAGVIAGPPPGAARTWRMTWRSEPWTTYRIEHSPDLTLWTGIAEGVPSGGDFTSFEYGNLQQGAGRGYFRIVRK